MITFLCSKCRKQHSVPDKWAGKTAKCPCGEELDVPCTFNMEPEVDQPELQDDTPNENEFVPADNDLASLQTTARRSTKKRTPAWLSAVKLLSPAAVAILLFFGFRDYLLPQTDTTSPQPRQQAQAWGPSHPSQETSPPRIRDENQRLAVTQEVGVEVKSEADADRDNLEIESEKPLTERPFRRTIAEVLLPSGRTISAKLLSPPEETEVTILQIRDTKHYYSKDANGRICAVCQYNHKSRKIDGLVMRTHTNGTMSSLASFHKSKRDGPLYCWNQDGKICYYCDWVNGNKQGLSCLFNDEKPTLIQEWKANKLLCQYRVDYQDSTKPKLEKVALDSEATSPLEEQIAHLEQNLGKADIKLRRNFVRDFKKMSQNVRIEAAQPSPERLALIAQRDTAEQLKSQAAETVFWQRATNGTQWSGRERWLAPKTKPHGARGTTRR